MALTQVKAGGLTADLIDETKLADNSIDSEHYNDGSIDTIHLADQAVDLTKLPHGDGTSNGKFLRSNNGADPTWVAVTSTPEGTAVLSTGEAATKYLRADGDNSSSWQTVTTTTETAYTSCGTGTTSEITGVASTAKIIKIVGHDVSFGANSAKLRLRLGSASGYKTSGYLTTCSEGGGSNSGTSETDGFTQEYVGGASYRMTFIWDLVNVNANIWTIKGMLNAWTGSGNAENTHFFVTGRVDLGATLTKLQFDASNGADFDDGDWKLAIRAAGEHSLFGLREGTWESSRWNELLDASAAFAERSGLLDDAQRVDLLHMVGGAIITSGLVDSDLAVRLCMLGESAIIVPSNLIGEYPIEWQENLVQALDNRGLGALAVSLADDALNLHSLSQD